MVISVMTAEDYDDVYALWLATPGMALYETDDSREGIARYLKRNPNTSFVARENGRLIGAILCGNDGRRGFIHHTAVAQSERRRGVGRALVNAALDALRKEGLSKVFLVVFKSNTSGDRFWKNLGFSLREDINYRDMRLVELNRAAH